MRKHTTLTYRPDIDGLRAIAVLSVVAFHAAPMRITGGFVGVDVFFVISGYLISGIVLKNIAEKRFSFADFYVRRIKRIFPALLLILAACCGFGWFAMLPNEYVQLGKHVAAAVGFVLNFVLWKEAGYFDTEAIYKPLLHLWSLSIEEQFYIVWPAVLLFSWRRGYNLFAVAAGVAALSFLCNVAVVHSFPVADFFMPFTRAWELMVGSMLACVERRRDAPPDLAEMALQSHPVWLRLWWRDAAALLGITTIVAAVVLVSPQSAFPGWWSLLPTTGAFLLILAGMGAWLNRRILALRPLVFVGLISYPLYLWHWPLLSFAWLNSVGDPSKALRVGLIGASIILAWLTYELLERPIRSAQSVRAAPALLAVAIVIGITGYALGRGYGVKFQQGGRHLVAVTDFDVKFPSKFYSEIAPCHDTTVDGARIYECRNNTAVDPVFAVFGDSHAEVLYPGLAGALPNVSSLYLQSCAFPQTGLTVTNKPFNQYCASSTVQRQIVYLSDIRSLKTVVLSFRGPLYLTGTGFGVGSQEREHNVVITGENSAERHMTQARLFSVGLSSAIDMIRHAGKKVVMVMDFPELGFDVTDCIDSRLFSPKFPDCRVPLSAVKARQGEYRAVIDDLAKNAPDIGVFDTRPLLCDEQYCYGIKDHRALYKDDDHIGIYGSYIIGKKLAEFLRLGGFLN